MDNNDVNNYREGLNIDDHFEELELKFNRYKTFLANVEILACVLMILGYIVLMQAAKADIQEINETEKGLEVTVDPATLTLVSYRYILVSMTLLYVVAAKRSDQRTLELSYGIDAKQTDLNFKNIARGYGISIIADVIRVIAAQNISDINGSIETLV